MVGPVADTERLVPEVDEEVRVLGFVYVQCRELEGVLRLMNAQDDQAAHLRVLADVIERVRSGKRLRLPPAVSSSVLNDRVLSGLCLSGGQRGSRLSGPAVELTAVTLRTRIDQTSVRTP